MALNVPPSLRAVAPFVKLSEEYSRRGDPVVEYWALMYAVQSGMKVDKSSPEAVTFLSQALNKLEQLKQANQDKDSIREEVIGQAYVENQALTLFRYGDENDRAGVFNKNVVKSFYMAGQLFDVLSTFGEVDENLASSRKYAKWKATYIHTCLKNGETPQPGPPSTQGADDQSNGGGGFDALGAPPPVPSFTDFGFGPNPVQQQPQQPHFGPGPGHGQPPAGGYGSPGPQVPPGVGGYGFSTPNLQQHYPSPQQPQHPPQYQQPHPVAPPRPSVQSAPQLPTQATSTTTRLPNDLTPASDLKLEDYLDARKYAKYAISACDYEDAPSAIENLVKAIHILQKKSVA